MRQSIRMCITKMLSRVAVMSAIVGMGVLASCNSKQTADLVVYG